jgi:hypothetical protein
MPFFAHPPQRLQLSIASIDASDSCICRGAEGGDFEAVFLPLICPFSAPRRSRMPPICRLVPAVEGSSYVQETTTLRQRPRPRSEIDIDSYTSGCSLLPPFPATGEANPLRAASPLTHPDREDAGSRAPVLVRGRFCSCRHGCSTCRLPRRRSGKEHVMPAQEVAIWNADRTSAWSLSHATSADLASAFPKHGHTDCTATTVHRVGLRERLQTMPTMRQHSRMFARPDQTKRPSHGGAICFPVMLHRRPLDS